MCEVKMEVRTTETALANPLYMAAFEKMHLLCQNKLKSCA